MPAESEKPSEVPDPLIGTDVNATYRILRKIGWGGMGTIYEAAHVHLPKRFALKVMLPEVAADEVAFERFRREAVTTSSLGNPHIAEVVDFNILPDGSPFMVMEYLDGEDLSYRLYTRKRLPPVEVAKMVTAVSSALSAAHARGIFHRDIKPGNIFLARSPDGAEVVKLLDFGAAKSLRSNELTARGQIVGTAWYMSPEQARGQELDARSDEFSLAVVAYEALTGKVPFEGEEPVKVLFKIVDEMAAPLSSFGLALEVERVIDRALAKDRAARYPTVAEFAEALNAALGDRAPAPGPATDPSMPSLPASGPPSSAAIRVSDPSLDQLPRHTRPMIRLALIAALALGGAAYLLVSHSPPPPMLPLETVAVPDPKPPPVVAAAVVAAPAAPPVTAPKPTQIAVDTDPPGAAVSVDGKPKGNAPLIVKGLGLGSHAIVAQRADRPDVTRSVVLDSDGQSMEILLRFPAVLTAPPARAEPERRAVASTKPSARPAPAGPAKMGKLSLDTTPWTTVSEAGSSLGETPLAAVPLAVGIHRLHLVNPDSHLDQTIEVTIAADKTTVTKLHF